MSRNGTRDTNLIPKDKVPAFLKIMNVMTEQYGSVHAACNKAGVAHGHWWQVANGDKNLSVTTAKRILAAYKAMKAGNGEATP